MRYLTLLFLLCSHFAIASQDDVVEHEIIETAIQKQNDWPVVKLSQDPIEFRLKKFIPIQGTTKKLRCSAIQLKLPGNAGVFPYDWEFNIDAEADLLAADYSDTHISQTKQVSKHTISTEKTLNNDIPRITKIVRGVYLENVDPKIPYLAWFCFEKHFLNLGSAAPILRGLRIVSGPHEYTAEATELENSLKPKKAKRK